MILLIIKKTKLLIIKSCHSEGEARRISYKPKQSFRAVGEESHTSLARDISLSLNMTQ